MVIETSVGVDRTALALLVAAHHEELSGPVHLPPYGRQAGRQPDDALRVALEHLPVQAGTRVPMVLNTSFNENEPVVCRPEEALDCFLRTKMDVLVMGGWVVERR